MRFRKLRIAWSVVCVVACVLLIVLWVRSLQWADMLTVRCGSEQTYYAVSFRGKVAVVPLPLSTNQQFDPAGNKVFPSGLVSRRFVGTGTLLRTNGKVTVHAFTNVGRTGEMWGLALTPIVLVPYWMITAPAVVLCVLAAVPFLRWRFSLRTLLIATTLVAALLGLIVWAAAK